LNCLPGWDFQIPGCAAVGDFFQAWGSAAKPDILAYVFVMQDHIR